MTKYKNTKRFFFTFLFPYVIISRILFIDIKVYIWRENEVIDKKRNSIFHTHDITHRSHYDRIFKAGTYLFSKNLYNSLNKILHIRFYLFISFYGVIYCITHAVQSFRFIVVFSSFLSVIALKTVLLLFSRTVS